MIPIVLLVINMRLCDDKRWISKVKVKVKEKGISKGHNRNCARVLGTLRNS